MTFLVVLGNFLLENEIMEAIRTGNFEYDISGGAR
jgi:hypothetical protein